METKYINGIQQIELLKQAGKAIANGKLVIFPTETVYGIGANALDAQAVQNIFKAKGRAQDNPLIVHIAHLEEVNDLVKEVNEIEKKLMEAFWPGPLTIILPKKECIPSVTSANLDTVGIRMPSNGIARRLIEYAKVPIAAPSANVSGKPSGTLLSDIRDEFEGKVDYMIDGGEASIGVESTVVRVIDGKVHILRPGGITKENIISLLGEVVVDKHVLGKLEEKEEVRSPGMKYRHYAPNTTCILVRGKENAKVVAKIQEEIQKNPKTLVLAKTQNIEQYDTKQKIAMGSTLEEISHNIFTLLRKVDRYPVEQVLIEATEEEGLGLAILNRLLRACEYHVINC